MVRSRIKFQVYEIDQFGERHWLGDTRAVSPEQANNNVRFRLFGETSVEDLGIEFMAEQRVEVEPKQPLRSAPQSPRTSRWLGRQLVWREFLRPSPIF